jgi:enterochelin esterase-like enzyme
MPYFVYLPPGYQDEHRLYPVLYMLHGNSGSYEEWLAYGLIDRADRMISTKEIAPLVIVLPQGDFSYWIDHLGGEPAWGDYVSIDLPRHVEATYRVFSDPTRRAIGGLSMGGSGALLNALWNPTVFGIVGAHSPSLPAEGEREFLGTGDDYAIRDPISVARLRPRGQLSTLNIWIDSGVEDPWFERATQLHNLLNRRGIDHYWRTYAGGHDGDYWSAHIPDYLRFYDAALNPDRPGLEAFARE